MDGHIFPSKLLNSKWPKFASSRKITTPYINDLDLKSKKIFCIGSCFAEEIRLALEKQSIEVYPNFTNIAADSRYCRFDELPNRHHMNYYNVYSIESEFRKASGSKRRDISSDLWCLENLTYKEEWKIAKRSKESGDNPLYLDPYRRLCFSSSLDYFIDLVDSVDKAFQEAFQVSNFFVITLGMSEVFLDRKTKLPLNQLPATAPHYPEGREPLFACLNEERVYQSLKNIHQLITNKDIPAKLLITVSPVPLNRTFRKNMDVVSANAFSKAVNLSAVSRLLQDNFDNVHYFPSYEFITLPDQSNFMEDYQHVNRDKVEKIIKSFLEATSL